MFHGLVRRSSFVLRPRAGDFKGLWYRAESWVRFADCTSLDAGIFSLHDGLGRKFSALCCSPAEDNKLCRPTCYSPKLIASYVLHVCVEQAWMAETGWAYIILARCSSIDNCITARLHCRGNSGFKVFTSPLKALELEQTDVLVSSRSLPRPIGMRTSTALPRFEDRHVLYDKSQRARTR